MDERLTNGLHDELWIKGARALPDVENSLRVANAISCVKELYALGEISKDDYKETLIGLLKESGYKY